jgi:hypothetical protein
MQALTLDPAMFIFNLHQLIKRLPGLPTGAVGKLYSADCKMRIKSLDDFKNDGQYVPSHRLALSSSLCQSSGFPLMIFKNNLSSVGCAQISRAHCGFDATRD